MNPLQDQDRGFVVPGRRNLGLISAATGQGCSRFSLPLQLLIVR